LVTVPVRKPDKTWFVRVHPSEDYRLQTVVVQLAEENEFYLVDKPLWPEMAAETTFSPRVLFTAMNRQGVCFLWPARLPRPDGQFDNWGLSALEAVQMAQKTWVRVTSNKSLGAYEVFEATAKLPEPDWPKLPFKELLRVAFKDKFIGGLDHPVLRKLRGEV
jgi:hypothetical protein